MLPRSLLIGSPGDRVLAYVDSSVLLRVVFGEPTALPEFREIDYGVSSELLQVECLRTIDRLRFQVPLDDQDVSARRTAVYRAVRAMEIVPIVSEVVQRATEPFPTALGTLDALHLSTALLWIRMTGKQLTLVTHDRELATAARAVGLEVLGVPPST